MAAALTHRGGRKPMFDHADAVEQWRSGRYATLTALAADLGVTRFAVQRVLKLRGEPIPGPGPGGVDRPRPALQRAPAPRRSAPAETTPIGAPYVGGIDPGRLHRALKAAVPYGLHELPEQVARLGVRVMIRRQRA